MFSYSDFLKCCRKANVFSVSELFGRMLRQVGAVPSFAVGRGYPSCLVSCPKHPFRLIRVFPMYCPFRLRFPLLPDQRLRGPQSRGGDRTVSNPRQVGSSRLVSQSPFPAITCRFLPLVRSRHLCESTRSYCRVGVAALFPFFVVPACWKRTQHARLRRKPSCCWSMKPCLEVSGSDQLSRVLSTPFSPKEGDLLWNGCCQEVDAAMPPCRSGR